MRNVILLSGKLQGRTRPAAITNSVITMSPILVEVEFYVLHIPLKTFKVPGDHGKMVA